MQKFIMEVSKTDKVKKERVNVGQVEVTTPTIEDILPIVASAKVKELDQEDGLPVYDTEEANWIFGAILAAVKAGARNKLQSGTATVKDGLTIPTNWAELVAEGTRTGGAALAALRDCKASFAAWVATLNKKEATAQTIIQLFSNRQALELQSAAMKEKMAKYVEDYAASLSEEDLERFMRPIEAVTATCSKETVDVEDDM